MNWNDIDFSAIKNMVDSLSDEEKSRIQDMARQMMSQNALKKDEEGEEEKEVSLAERLGFEESLFVDLPGKMQDALEAADDMEDYYEDDPEADFSAAALFYAKALLEACRHALYEPIKTTLAPKGFGPKACTTLAIYRDALNEDGIHALVDAGHGESAGWMELKALLAWMELQLQRAEYDVIAYPDLLVIKQKLLEEKGILRPLRMEE